MPERTPEIVAEEEVFYPATETSITLRLIQDKFYIITHDENYVRLNHAEVQTLKQFLNTYC